MGHLDDFFFFFYGRTMHKMKHSFPNEQSMCFSLRFRECSVHLSSWTEKENNQGNQGEFCQSVSTQKLKVRNKLVLCVWWAWWIWWPYVSAPALEYAGTNSAEGTRLEQIQPSPSICCVWHCRWPLWYGKGMCGLCSTRKRFPTPLIWGLNLRAEKDCN